MALANSAVPTSPIAGIRGAASKPPCKMYNVLESNQRILPLFSSNRGTFSGFYLKSLKPIPPQGGMDSAIRQSENPQAVSYNSGESLVGLIIQRDRFSL